MQYVDDVLRGRLPACEYVRQACERQRRDLDDENLGYVFDVDRASRPCALIEHLPHIKGKWAGQRIRLEPWQVFLVTTVFGWVDDQGARRYKTAYIEVPRKNAKSTLSAGIALYCMAGDREGGAEVYSAATTRDQARIVFGDAKRMVERSPDLRRHGFATFAHAITYEPLGASFRALSRDQGGNLDGLNVHCAIVDELHAHKTRDVWDVLETATGARQQPLIWAITTAGSNRAGICYEQRSYALKVLGGAVDDPEYFAVVYTVDDGDDWTDEATWRKANPNWGVSVSPDDMARKARKAMEMSSAQNNFLTKHLNVWVNADTSWMDMRAWDGLAGYDEDLDGVPCWIGVDLATKTDIAAVVLLFAIDGQYRVSCRFYLPEDAVDASRNSQYSGWVRDGHIITTPGNVIDLDTIEEDILQLAGEYNVQGILYDPWQAQQMVNHLVAQGLPMVEFRHTVQNMSEPMKQLEAEVIAGRLRHDGNPAMAWMMSNVVAHTDAKENIYPRKEFPENKIDGPVALIMALAGAIHDTGGNEPSIYETGII